MRQSRLTNSRSIFEEGALSVCSGQRLKRDLAATRAPCKPISGTGTFIQPTVARVKARLTFTHICRAGTSEIATEHARGWLPQLAENLNFKANVAFPLTSCAAPSTCVLPQSR
jgi:hypothetical protein